MARAVGIYDQSLRSAIQALKFNAMMQLAAPLGRLLYVTFRQYWATDDVDLIALAGAAGLRAARPGCRSVLAPRQHGAQRTE